MNGRWPPRGPAPAPDHAGAYDRQFAELGQAVGDLTAVITGLAPKVLGSRLVALDANGQAAGNLRVPYQALSVTSFSTSTLTVAAAPLGSSAPGPGPGVCQIPPRGFRVYNARAHAWSIYGGSPGDLVFVEAFALPQPPAAAILTVPFTPVGSVMAYASVATPAAGAAVASTGALAAGVYQVSVNVNLQGAPAASDINNLQLQVGATVIGTLKVANAAGSHIQNPLITVQVPAGAAITANAIVLGVGTYDVQIVATRIA